MNKFKTISIVTVIVIVLIIVLNFLVGWYVDMSLEKRRAYTNSTRGEFRYRLPNYAKLSWAKKHFEEFGQLNSRYSSYVGWRRTEFSGETITIDKEGFRVNPQRTSQSAGKEAVWFFGSSTMWGTGADDASTIPAYFESFQDRYIAKNYGESAWRSRQELSLLINRLFIEKTKPSVVVFYDGSNDFYSGVMQGTSKMKHHYEKTLNDLSQQNMKKAPLDSWIDLTGLGFKKVFADGFISLINIAKRKLWVDASPEGLKSFISDGFDAVTSSAKPVANKDVDQVLAEILKPYSLTASQKELVDICVAEELYNYKIANEICNLYGIKFMAVLQPSAWVGSPYRKHIVNDLAASPKYVGSLYRYYYEQITSKAKDLPYFYDLAHAFDVEDPIYIDFCHVSPNGNKIIAQEVVKLLSN